jgi:hypothetical protein
MASRSPPPQAGQVSQTQPASTPAGGRAGRQPSTGRAPDPLTRGFGWASAGLGVPMLVAPRWFSRFIGVGEVPGHQATTAVVGVRGLAAAVALLASENPVRLWARKAGDFVDLSLLGWSLANHDRRGLYRTVAATAAAVAITGADISRTSPTRPSSTAGTPS